ncbi:TIGR02117 family protein [Parasphingopyxis marina]|uniref:TIGR02117 family protein n=1 Tax=Parasphingopyxis marina TaxID=2761622 RepID=A0A842I0T1_9SPHN|nr:TIGR02117 family protein [Parasphingopyxis marina]MBC2778812.1 TIGR02117 family protein [Parasphingopyxis marina]
MRLLRTAITRNLLRLGAIIALYILAGIGGSLIPANADWEEPDTGILLYVHDNGIHTGLVLPRENAIADWSDLVRPEHLGDPRRASDHLLFGWGDRGFYLETPTWGDLKASTALAALIGSEGTLLHVDHIGTPRPGENLRPLRVAPEQYRRIASAIRARFALDAEGRSQPIAGYGANDVFYEAHGRYNALRTCNEWTGSVLRDAGVRMGAWTPFNFGVMRWLRSHAVDTD